MKAEFNPAGRTDLEVYVPYAPKSAGWQSTIAGEESAITRARIYIEKPMLEFQLLVPSLVGDPGFRR
jgi:hypothetical protein